MKRFTLFGLGLALLLLLAGSTLAFAQDDDTATADDDTTPVDDDAADDDVADDDVADDDASNPFEATLEFTSPAVLEGGQFYEFQFTVNNTTLPAAGSQHWIYIVELYMPSNGYQIDETNISVPDDLHGGAWDAGMVEDTQGNPIGIKWEHTLGTTSASHGDIQEGEYMEFSYMATTDEEGTDGFDFKMTADSGSTVTGTAYIGEEPGDDDDSADDTEDDDDADDDDDDNDSSGCGC